MRSLNQTQRIFVLFLPLILIFFLLVSILIYRARKFDKILVGKGLEFGKTIKSLSD